LPVFSANVADHLEITGYTKLEPAPVISVACADMQNSDAAVTTASVQRRGESLNEFNTVAPWMDETGLARALLLQVLGVAMR
jgi:hypothetical protein